MILTGFLFGLAFIAALLVAWLAVHVLEALVG